MHDALFPAASKAVAVISIGFPMSVKLTVTLVTGNCTSTTPVSSVAVTRDVENTYVMVVLSETLNKTGQGHSTTGGVSSALQQHKIKLFKKKLLVNHKHI